MKYRVLESSFILELEAMRKAVLYSLILMIHFYYHLFDHLLNFNWPAAGDDFVNLNFNAIKTEAKLKTIRKNEQESKNMAAAAKNLTADAT